MQQQSSRDCSTVAQLILSIVGMLVYGAAAVLFITVGFSREGAMPSLTDSIPSRALGCVAIACLLLLIPSFVLSIRRLRGGICHPVISSNRRLLLLASLGLVLWAGILMIGETLIQTPALHFLLPVLTVLGAGLPIWWIVELGRLHLSAGSSQRSWGLFGFSLTVTPPIILIVESIILVVAFLFLFIALSGTPQFKSLVEEFINSASSGAIPDLQAYETFFTGFIQKPYVLLGLLAITSLIIPLLEELLKPLALLVIASRKPTPGQGFVGGLICGAAFAFLETSGTLVSSIDSGWVVLVLMRLGTGLLHITASGLVGLGLARAWQAKKSRYFFRNYMLAVLMHGTWNAFGVMLGYLPIIGPSFEMDLPFASWMARVAPYMLILFSVGLIVVLISLNRRLQRETAPPILPSSLEPPLPTMP
jgi:hypothetical protein